MLLAGHLDRTATIMESLPTARLEYIALIDHRPAHPSVYKYTRNGETCSAPVGRLEALPGLQHLEKIYPVQPDDPAAQGLEYASHILAPYKIRPLYLIQSEPLRCPGMKHAPSLLNDSGPLLQKVYDSLADESSREVYAARVKAMLTGNPGYLPVSEYPEYYHPLVHPEPGDVMIDGGVSDMVGAQARFARSIGESGAIHGFEPIPYMFESARQTLAKFPQYHLHCMGLGEKEEEVQFCVKHDSSHVAAKAGEDTITCKITSLDAFVTDRRMGKVDCIKLDVEGSELAALMGAKETILKHHPKLIICLYHKVEDIITIPLLIKKLVPEYKLYIEHSSISFLDTILYTRVPD